MNIQAEKIELIKLITETESEKVIKKLKEILTSSKKDVEAESPAMAKRLAESRHQIKEGKGVKVPLDDIWK